jgi:FlaA1/EpsC-like NDP-sugar epimerase
VLIVGAGGAGEMLARDLLRHAQRGYRPIAYVDDQPQKQGVEIYGIRVRGEIATIPKIVQRDNIDLVLIAIPSATSKTMRRIVDLCNEAKVAYRTLPALGALISGEVSVNDLREVSLEDLLGREPINLHDASLASFFRQKSIVVTGGGGSIGAELCRQLAEFQLAELILIEHSEFNLYSVDIELKKVHPNLKFKSYLQDVTEGQAVHSILEKHQPDILFHAAAYKHVPMLEEQVRVAVKNNIFGTRCVAEAAVNAKVKKFILISTDKAVNPTNVMGTTKRTAEIFCQNYNAQQNTTKFITVRFGNVLGSAGSVVPLFKKQIEEGGPVTITHPDITRYFMTIPEASQLILRASTMGQGGEIYVLDMGEPIKIKYLAEQLIKLSGKKLHEDMEIVVTGLRPGEKLYEELFHEGEALQATQHEKILQASSRKVAWEDLLHTMDELQAACDRNDAETLLALLKQTVPENKIS